MTQAECWWDVCVREDDWVVHQAIASLLQGTAHEASEAHPDSRCHCMRNAVIESVHRVENYRLWQQYVDNLKDLERSSAYGKVEPELGIIASDQKVHADALCRSMGLHLSTSVNEQLLFHGTDWNNASSIVVSGFEPWLTNHAMYGQGTYFASQAC